MPLPVVLEVHCGPIPSFKNRKRIRGKRLVLDRDVAKRKASLTRAFESALRFWSQTAASATATGCSPPSLIALSMPFDDSLNWIPEASFNLQMVPKGREGVTLVIEKLPD